MGSNVFICSLSHIEIRGATVYSTPRSGGEPSKAPLGRISGVLIYRDERLGLLMENDDVVDVPVSRNSKLIIAEAIAKAAGFYQAVF